MPTLEFLEKQLGLYQDQAEAWRAAHGKAMHCRDIEEALRYGLFLLETIRRHNDRWAADIESGEVEFSWDAAAQFARAYRWWRDESATLVAAIAALEQQGFQIEGAAGFRENYREVCLLPLEIERSRAAISSLMAGQGISLRQAMDELRHSRQ